MLSPEQVQHPHQQPIRPRAGGPGWWAGLALIGAALLFAPQFVEGADNNCIAVERVFVRTEIKKDSGMSDADIASFLQFAGLDGSHATTNIRRNYPQVPPVLGCALLYYTKLAEGGTGADVNSLGRVSSTGEGEAKAKAKAEAEARAKQMAELKVKVDPETRAKLQADVADKFNPGDISRLLQSREPAQSSGAAARERQKTASLGTASATAQGLNASQRDALMSLLRDQLHRCWKAPVTATTADKPPVPSVRVKLNQDGSLAAEPVVVNSSSDPLFRAVADSAMRATRRCAPLRIPAQYQPYYQDWKDLVINFDPREIG